MKKDVGPFETWFVEQFGKRPSKMSILALEGDVMDRGYELRKAEDIYNSCKKWDETFNNCLMAWNASEWKKSS